MLLHFISIFDAHAVMYFNSVLLFTDPENCAWYVEPAFDGFLDGDRDVLIIFGLKPLLGLVVRFGSVQGDS